MTSEMKEVCVKRQRWADGHYSFARYCFNEWLHDTHQDREDWLIQAVYAQCRAAHHAACDRQYRGVDT